jgi:hypothetical protein
MSGASTPQRIGRRYPRDWLDNGGAEGDLMELMAGRVLRCSRGTAGARAAPGHAVIMTTSWALRR